MSHKNTFIVIFSVLFVSLSHSAVKAEDGLHPSLKKVHKAFPKSGQSSHQTSESSFLSVEEIYPLGFSREGLFAYIRFAESGFCGRCGALEIVDLATNKLKLAHRFEDNVEIVQVVKDRGAEFSKILSESKIVAMGTSTLRKFPLSIAGDNYETTVLEFISKENFNCNSQWGQDAQHVAIEVSVRSRKGKTKEVTRIKGCKGFDLLLERIEGFFLSPDEKFLALIGSGTHYVLEHESRQSVYVYGLPTKFLSE